MTACEPKLRIALFTAATGFGRRALQEVLSAHWSVVALALFRQERRGLRALLPRAAGMHSLSPLEHYAREQGIAVIHVTDSNGPAVAERLRSARPDLICVATFPRLIPREITGLAPLGAINVHPSLLPRHRGPLPLFWTYYGDDRTAGVTVHHLSDAFDSGDIILREGFPLPRGYCAATLSDDVARRGATLLRAAAHALVRDDAPRVAQDERAATYAPRIRSGAAMVRFDEWDVERVWHFLASLVPRFREPLTDSEGRVADYCRVTGFERGRSGTPGTVERVIGGWKLHCRSGVVLLGSGGRAHLLQLH